MTWLSRTRPAKDLPLTGNAHTHARTHTHTHTHKYAWQTYLLPCIAVTWVAQSQSVALLVCSGWPGCQGPACQRSSSGWCTQMVSEMIISIGIRPGAISYDKTRGNAHLRLNLTQAPCGAKMSYFVAYQWKLCYNEISITEPRKFSKSDILVYK